MALSPFEPSIREQQVAMSVLAHVARRDAEAVAASMVVIADRAENVRPMGIISALLEQFERGIDDIDDGGAELANWFAAQAQALAARERAA